MQAPKEAPGLTRRFVLDSYALLIYLQDKPGAQVVEDAILDDGAELFMISINLGEVLYLVERASGQEAARAVEDAVLDTPKVTVMDASWARVRSAASLKAAGGLSFADCFAAGLAAEFDATLITCDPEFRGLEAAGRLRVQWIPA